MPDAWTASQIEGAVIAILTQSFPDWTVSGIKIGEQEAAQLASDIVRSLRGESVFLAADGKWVNLRPINAGCFEDLPKTQWDRVLSCWAQWAN